MGMLDHYSQDPAAQGDGPPPWTPAALLDRLGSELGGCSRVDLEFSLRLRPACVEARGRFGCWLAGSDPATFQPVARVLDRLGAPATVRAAHRQAEGPVRQGLSIAFDRGGPEFRLYLHGRDRSSRADRYKAWRWRGSAEPRVSHYRFHFLPETPSGQRPFDLVDDRLRPAFVRLLAEDRLQQYSGFWLREGPDGAIDQVDLAFPWGPRAGSLPGLEELADLLELPPGHMSRWRGLSIRHVAFRVGVDSPLVALYASAPRGDGPWPASEPALQAKVRRGARAFHRAIEVEVFRRLPAVPSSRVDRPGLDLFYDGKVSTWQAVLGPEMHYHAGLFRSPELDPDDSAMAAALRRAVTELYPFVPAGGRVYDLGCGWGGALAMWTRDLGCPSLGLTISRGQFRYVAALGLPVRWGDAERTLPPGCFDCVILLESFCHIVDKERLLRILRVFADRLVMRVNCQDGVPASSAFGGTMQMISSARLRVLLESTGWRVTHWRDRRREALPSVAVWHRRLRTLIHGDDTHLEVLRAWCDRVMDAPEAWARSNPLIELIAD